MPFRQLGALAQMGGVVAQPNNGISTAVKHNAEIHRHTDITGTILRLIPRTPAFQQKLAKRADLLVFPNLIATAIQREKVSRFFKRSPILAIA